MTILLFPSLDLFQSTLPQGERRCNNGYLQPQAAISIHAPTRGATESWITAWNLYWIFQSTLPQGERLNRCECVKDPQQFQSTLPQGERPAAVGKLDVEMGISIHAPTRGATGSRHQNVGSIHYFNPRSHKGSDRNGLHILENPFYFNPRSHKGSDAFPLNLVQNIQISIHAPTRGATVMYQPTGPMSRFSTS